MFDLFGEILSNSGKLLPKFIKFQSNLTNVGLTTNGRLAMWPLHKWCKKSTYFAPFIELLLLYFLYIFLFIDRNI